ncbi:hypothetical protein KSP40_PGU004322 [Platanthera guangdongensis]|uniref:Remorin C-terminal domain-containing protein n=1 Tax=Platanthera guangdongensis TaxID=2320717 RepID=A0ABR2MYS9_9ASPA
MDYERIHKVQMGVISPSKLRMKILGAQNIKRHQGGSSSRASPSKVEDTECAKRNLLTGELDEEDVPTDFSATSINTKSSKSEVSTKEFSGNREGNQCETSSEDSVTRKSSDTKYSRNQNNNRNSSQQIQHGSNFTTQSMRHQEEVGNGYDSGHDNASTSSFEFHREDNINHHPIISPFYRNVPSKWNDAEKWLVSRQTMQTNVLKKNFAYHQCNRPLNSSWARLTPKFMITDQKISLKQSVESNPNSLNKADEFSFVSRCLHSTSISSNISSSCFTNPSQDSCDSVSLGRLPKELDHQGVSVLETCLSKNSDVGVKQQISMKDVGTEMTPSSSQDPSRMGTPIENLTPSRSPIASIHSSPGRLMTVGISRNRKEKDGQKDSNKIDLSEKELQLNARREIAALGLQLGKLNIASWAGKKAESTSVSPKSSDEEEKLRKEYEARAKAWEEAVKAKRRARYEEEEIKILAWESHQREKYESRLRKAENRAIKMRSQAEAAMAEKLRKTEQTVEKKRARAEAKKKRQASRASQQAERIRRGGRAPPSHLNSCCSCWFLY